MPLSSSPEIFDNSHRAWLQPNSNYDLMSLRMLFLALTEMADALGKGDEAARWKRASDELGPYHVRADGTLRLSADADLPGSHRHLSNLMGLHPFNLITAEGGPGDARMISASLAEWDAKGTKAWCGYSFSWMSALRARVGQAEEALRLLEIYAKAFILRNGFHANGDQTKSGYSNFTYRPFTLEGNFLAMHAVHEMLLQSWSATPGARDTQVDPHLPGDVGALGRRLLRRPARRGRLSSSPRGAWAAPPPGSASSRAATAYCACATASAAAS